MNDAVRFSIDMQEQAGIDIVSDGEWRRETYCDVVGEIMNGFRWVKRDVFAYHQVIAEPMTPKRPGVVAEGVHPQKGVMQISKDDSIGF
jgi:methionine synthase II (cobalamin-independent)